MINFAANLNNAGLKSYPARLQKELRVAVAQSVERIKPVVEGQIVTTRAYDTFALLHSVYTRTAVASGYAKAVADAQNAYQNNPTKWPTIRGFNATLPVEPEVQVSGPDEAWVTAAASHGLPVETGYMSLFGNFVPPRPFMEQAAILSVPLVAKEFLKAFRRAR